MEKDMKLRKFIATTIREYLNEQNQYNKLVFVQKNNVDIIRTINYGLNELLNNHIFNDKNIYLKGGAARKALEIYLYGDSTDIIRDVDYCYIGDVSNYDELKTNEHVDYEGETIDDYFKNRDVTINEVLLRPDLLIFTRRAYRDFNNNKIIPKTIFINSRLYSRMLLFSIRYGYAIIDNIDIKNVEIFDFDFLVCLLKAYELNMEYEYYNICRKNNITKASNLSEWLVDLLSNVYSFDLYGREKYIAKEFLAYDGVKTSELYKQYPNLGIEVKKLDFNDTDFSKYMKKNNRRNKMLR